ncbi:MAG: ribosomal protein S18-alanine N-acetyltransferase [Candidatus Dormiibacterota bacterium]
MQLRQRTVIEEMTLDDVPAVQDIEREIFLTPWPRNAYRRELLQNKMASYIVLRDRDEIIGYAGLWKMHDEAHVTTVGVRRKDQGRGFGMALMLALISRAYTLQSRWMTLEVRASNYGAMALYEKLGFKVIGRRRGYYTDDGEDAVVMWSDSLLAPAFKERFTELRERYAEDIAFSAYPGD